MPVHNPVIDGVSDNPDFLVAMERLRDLSNISGMPLHRAITYAPTANKAKVHSECEHSRIIVYCNVRHLTKTMTSASYQQQRTNTQSERQTKRWELQDRTRAGSYVI